MSGSVHPAEFAVLDESVVATGSIQGVAAELARTSGAIASLTRLAPGATVDDHTHDHPYLSLYLLGAYQESGDGGEVAIDGPAAAFHPAGSAHADRIGRSGLATVVIEFEPRWLERALGRAAPDRSTYWMSGPAAGAAAQLTRSCLTPGGAPLADAITFLDKALGLAAHLREPVWLARLDALIEGGVEAPSVLAERLGVSDPWLARAYRGWRGEGLADRLRRRRIEAAVTLLEGQDTPLARVAAEAGFCDQSHMNRVFAQVLARTPAQVRAGGLRPSPRSLPAPAA